MDSIACFPLLLASEHVVQHGLVLSDGGGIDRKIELDAAAVAVVVDDLSPPRFGGDAFRLGVLLEVFRGTELLPSEAGWDGEHPYVDRQNDREKDEPAVAATHVFVFLGHGQRTAGSRHQGSTAREGLRHQAVGRMVSDIAS